MRCPACQRALDAGATPCPRCGADLTAFHTLLASADRHRRQGIRSLQQQSPNQALRHFRAACRIAPTPEAQQARAVAAMCSGRFHEALQAYCTTTKREKRIKV